MMETSLQLAHNERFARILSRLVTQSEADYYNPYERFHWPDSLPDEQYWMSPELLSTHGAEAGQRLSVEQLWAVSKWESINFYSMNVHGIRELLTEIIARIHTQGFELPSEYFHHIVGEENEHMWFFAQFCLRYGGKIYPNKSIKLAASGDAVTQNFLVFSRLLLFEEIVDHFNRKAGVDERLHPTIRQVNAVHHEDESRHIAFGRQIVALLHRKLRDQLGEEELGDLEAYLKRYLRASLDSLCSPAVFRDAGIGEPYRFRASVLADPARRAQERAILKRTTSFLMNEGIFRSDEIPAA
jgi:P-aminobenzoate N-oxygenase AurF